VVSIANHLSLIVDCTLEGLLLGLGRCRSNSLSDIEIIDWQYFTRDQQPSAKLPEIVRELVGASSYSISDLSSVVVGRGPGSFTGIKIGLAFVEGFAAIGGIEPIAVSSLGVLAGSLLDERRHLVYPMTKNSGLVALSAQDEFALVKIDGQGVHWSTSGKTFLGKNPPLFKSGYGFTVLSEWPLFNDALCDCYDMSVTNYADHAKWLVEAMMSEGLSLFCDGQSGTLEPLYCRKSAPEERIDESES